MIRVLNFSGFVTGSCISPSLSDERGMSSFISLPGIKRHKERGIVLLHSLIHTV